MPPMMLVAHDAAENRKTVVAGNGEEDPTTYDQWGCCRYPRWCEIFLPQSWPCDESARRVPGRASRSCRLSNSSGNNSGCIPDPILSLDSSLRPDCGRQKNFLTFGTIATNK